ncbi:MAG: AAA family ATPase [Verrucomicrobiales bacterium]
MKDLQALEAAVAVSPDNVPLLLLLASGYMEAFSFEEARARYEQALKVDPRKAAAKTGIAEILNISGKESEAILRIEQVCGDSPSYAPAWLLRARFALGEDNGADAREFYDRAVALDASLADEMLLHKIREAGGGEKPRNRGGSGGGGVVAKAVGGHQAGAFREADYDEDDDFFDDDDELPEGASMSDIGLEFLQRPDTKFDKVGGMEAVKEQIRMKILYPLQNRELFAAYGKKAGGGVLLYGPPGCGKTLISRATAGEIKANFLAVGLHQILDMWIGGSEQKLHRIFEFARQHAPAVLFFDEVDALAADRKDLRTSAGRTLINQFLAEMDGSVESNDGILILGATNAPWHLDPAFLRPGRFDRLIFVPPPDAPARAEIIKIMAEGKPVSGLDPDGLAKKLKEFSGADISAVFDRAIEEALDEAMRSGKLVPVTGKSLGKKAGEVKPSTKRWFESAKNYALYANQSGFYDDVLEYLGIKKP